MANAIANSIMEASTTTGTGTLTLDGVVILGYLRFQDAPVSLNTLTVPYRIEAVDANGAPTGQWEMGAGVFTTSGNTLTRASFYSSSTGSAINFSAGTKRVSLTFPIEWLASKLLAQTFTAQQVFETGAAGASPTIFRQTGGTPGVHEIQISHNGTDGTIAGKTGDFRFQASGGSFTFNQGFYEQDNYRWGIGMTTGFKVDGPSGLYFGFVNGPCYNAPDATFYRLAAGVIGVGTTGATGIGWLQNSGGEAALDSAFTKANATLGNTNLSRTLIAGRSYRIEGLLIASNTTAGEGFQCDFNGGAATATTFQVVLSAVGTNVAGTVVASAISTKLNYTSVTGTNYIRVTGYIKVNAGGTFILRAAEDTTATGTMTLAAGSWLAFYDTINL